MKNSLNKDKKFDISKINIDTVITFCRNNTRYVSAGILTIILVVVLAVTAANGEKTEGEKKEETQREQVADATDAYEVNANEELNNLVSRYYELYVAGNVDELTKIATPVSDMEKSYIQMMSSYVESYSNIVCYTKKGLEDNSFLVSATYDMKFKGTEGTVPGMEFFYVRAKEDGKLYIDNLYSSFNSEMEEQETDSEVMALIDKFKEASDVKELQANFQNRYTQAISADVNLQNMVNTVTEGIKNWASSYVANEQAAAEQAVAEQAAQQDANSGLNYLPEGTTLTVTDAYNLRVSMSETSDKVGTTAIGDTIKVILSYAEGWTKVEWNGKTGFIKTDLLLNN